MMKLKHYNDPGHGWVAVKRKLLVELGMIREITSYSYQRGETVYLEEDCDASRVLQEMSARGIKYELVDKYCDQRHVIRSYDTFIPRLHEVAQ